MLTLETRVIVASGVVVKLGIAWTNLNRQGQGLVSWRTLVLTCLSRVPSRLTRSRYLPSPVVRLWDIILLIVVRTLLIGRP